jgi:predicted dehydrogenase
MVLDAAAKIDEKKLCFVCGTQRRHHPMYEEIMRRIHDGAIGEVLGGQFYWNQASTWFKPREKTWSDLEWQIRDWNNFTWLSGDQILEQHVHNIDVMNWAMNSTPVSAYGMGGRQTRSDPVYGNVYDHVCVEYVFEGDKRCMGMCRQMDATDWRVAERVFGTRGVAYTDKGIIRGDTKAGYWKYEGDQNMHIAYVKEHADLIKTIREGGHINEARRIAESTLTGIMGRMSMYTGREVTWEQALNSKLSLFPEKLDFALNYPVPEVAMPGRTPLV